MCKEIFCVECLENVASKKVNLPETFDIRGESIDVDSTYYQCPNCGELMYDPETPSENLEEAYAEYRVRKNILTAEEIIEFRKRFGLSQRQFAKLLGWGHATISKYESGVLPSIPHNNTLALLREPENFRELLERNKGSLNDREYDRIKAKVEDYFEDNKENLFLSMADNLFVRETSLYTGYGTFDLDKVTQIVKFFAVKDEDLFKLRLLKYLFYSDFLFFKRFSVSLSGLTYQRFPMGPVPVEYDFLLDFVIKTGEVAKELIDFGYEHTGEKIIAVDDFDESYFSKDELDVLETVYQELKDYSSKAISELTHKEPAWLETGHLEYISYEHSDRLSLD